MCVDMHLRIPAQRPSSWRPSSREPSRQSADFFIYFTFSKHADGRVPSGRRARSAEVARKGGAVYLLSNFPGRADGERRGARSDREGGVGNVSVRRVFEVPSDRCGSSAFVVGMLRDAKKKTRRWLERAACLVRGLPPPMAYRSGRGRGPPRRPPSARSDGLVPRSGVEAIGRWLGL